jgi:hypothetical protein
MKNSHIGFVCARLGASQGHFTFPFFHEFAVFADLLASRQP